MSTDRQEYSPVVQRSVNEEYAQKHGLNIVGVYEDSGISGLTLRERPALMRLLLDVQKPKRRFDVVLVYDVSRWGRFQDVDESAYHEYLCRRAGVDVRYCAENFENDGSPARGRKNLPTGNSGHSIRLRGPDVAQSSARQAAKCVV